MDGVNDVAAVAAGIPCLSRSRVQLTVGQLALTLPVRQPLLKVSCVGITPNGQAQRLGIHEQRVQLLSSAHAVYRHGAMRISVGLSGIIRSTPAHGPRLSLVEYFGLLGLTRSNSVEVNPDSPVQLCLGELEAASKLHVLVEQHGQPLQG